MRGSRIYSSSWIDMRLPSSDLLRFTDRSEKDDRNSMGLTDEARSPHCQILSLRVCVLGFLSSASPGKGVTGAEYRKGKACSVKRARSPS